MAKKVAKRKENAVLDNDARSSKQQSSVNVLTPGADTAFKAFLSARFCAAIWAIITDCDETYNYWEPMHYLIYGNGLQTWEYSPEYALRSYTYLLLHGVPAWLYNQIFSPSPILVFYFTRCMMGLTCAVVEAYFYKAICREFGIHVGRLWLIFQLFSPGMFIASTALLPSSFAMYFCSAALAAWWHQKYKLAILFIAISTLLGWPFAALVGVPIAIDMLFRRKMVKVFIVWTAISAVIILMPMTAIDSNYYGKFTIAPLNLVVYNVFTSHGPNLYGVEPASFYLFNGILNFNIVFVLALWAPVILGLCHKFVPARSTSTLSLPYYLNLAPLYLWMLVFMVQPHKEERFLYPVYLMITLAGAVGLDGIQKLFFCVKSYVVKSRPGVHYLDKTMWMAGLAMIVTTILGLSRIFALYYNYHASVDIMMEFNNQTLQGSIKNSDNIVNVCIGKDWYRIPGNFYLPAKNYRVKFLKSEFKGILPAYFDESDEGTKIIHEYFNDQNKENEAMYFDYKKCDFLLDLDLGDYTDLEPNYAIKTNEWKEVKSMPFLNAKESNPLFRSFYFPYAGERHLTYGQFRLLQRKKIGSVRKN